MNKLILTTALCLAALSMKGCGSGDLSSTSETQSLVGDACSFYGRSMIDPNLYCASFSGGTKPTVLFELRGMNAHQVASVRRALDVVVYRLNDYSNGNLTLKTCALANTKKDLLPTNTKFASTLAAFTQDQRFAWAPTALAFGFAYHQKMATPAIIQGVDIAQTAAQKATDSYTVGQAIVGNDDLAGDNMNIELNRLAIGQFSADSVAGVIIHEFLHRRGYQHPGADADNPTAYSTGGSFINAIDLCISENNTPQAGVSLTASRGPKKGGG